jgi:hypothetical protein
MLSADPPQRYAGREVTGSGRVGPGRSSVLVGGDRAGTVVGIDPHKHTVTALVIDGRGGVVGGEHFKISGDGHGALEARALSFGAVARWGVETPPAGVGTPRSTWPAAAMTCATCAPTAPPARTAPVSGASPARWTPSGSRARHSPIHSCRAPSSAPARRPAPDAHGELLALWHKQRRSLLKSRQQLLNEAEFLLAELPLELRERLPDTKAVRPRLAALRRRNRRARCDAPTTLRLRLLDDHRAQIARLDAAERDATTQLRVLVAGAPTTLAELCGLSTRGASAPAAWRASTARPR